MRGRESQVLEHSRRREGGSVSNTVERMITEPETGALTLMAMEEASISILGVLISEGEKLSSKFAC